MVVVAAAVEDGGEVDEISSCFFFRVDFVVGACVWVRLLSIR